MVYKQNVEEIWGDAKPLKSHPQVHVVEQFMQKSWQHMKDRNYEGAEACAKMADVIFRAIRLVANLKSH